MYQDNFKWLVAFDRRKYQIDEDLYCCVVDGIVSPQNACVGNPHPQDLRMGLCLEVGSLKR